ncbi:MAG TPA: hypothetical protein VGQ83_23230, partial [Polyangia bacterium]
LEAPTITRHGVLAAGGGGGGGGGCWTGSDGSNGEDAHEDGTAAAGGSRGCDAEGTGGPGGALSQPASAGSSGAYNGGGGGGSAGRLHLKSRTSAATVSGTLSPSSTSGLVLESSLTRL